MQHLLGNVHTHSHYTSTKLNYQSTTTTSLEILADMDNLKTIMVTNDDGIDAPGLQALVRVLVSTNLYRILVCAPDSY